MPILTRGALDAQFLVSEANNYRSRQVVTIDAGQGALDAGTVLGQVTSDSEYIASLVAAVDGSEVAAAVLLHNMEAGGGEATVILRDAEVRRSDMTFDPAATGPQLATAEGELASVGIIVR